MSSYRTKAIKPDATMYAECHCGYKTKRYISAVSVATEVGLHSVEEHGGYINATIYGDGEPKVFHTKAVV